VLALPALRALPGRVPSPLRRPLPAALPRAPLPYGYDFLGESTRHAQEEPAHCLAGVAEPPPLSKAHSQQLPDNNLPGTVRPSPSDFGDNVSAGTAEALVRHGACSAADDGGLGGGGKEGGRGACWAWLRRGMAMRWSCLFAGQATPWLNKI
jgi:hypothetical protein